MIVIQAGAEDSKAMDYINTHNMQDVVIIAVRSGTGPGCPAIMMLDRLSGTNHSSHCDGKDPAESDGINFS